MLNVKKCTNKFASITFLALMAAGLSSTADAELMAYVTNGTDGTVSEIDIATRAVTQTFTVGTAPVGIAADTVNNLVYVANSGSASVTKIDVISGGTSDLSIPGSILEDVAVSPDGSLIFVSSLENRPFNGGSRGVIYVIDGTTFTVVDEVLVEDDPEGLVISGDGHQLWTASDIKVQEIELTGGVGSFTLTDVITGSDGVDDFEAVAVADNKSTLYATNATPSELEVIDLSTETIITSVATGTDPEEVALRPGTTELHVTNQGGNSLTVISTDTNSVLGTVNFSLVEPRGMAFLPDGSEGYVVMAGSNAVIYYDPATRTETGSIPVGTAPEDIVIFDVVASSAIEIWSIY